MRTNQHGLFVEFAGVPAAGKTTVANAILDRIQDRGVEPNLPTERINSLPIYTRVPTKLMYASLATISQGPDLHQMERKIVNSEQKQHRDTVALLVNFAFLAGVIQQYRKNSITILDQGIHQAVWSVGFRSFQSWNEVYDDWLPVPQSLRSDLLVVIRSDVDTLEQRLAQRRTRPSRLTGRGDEVEHAINGIELMVERLSSGKEHPRVIEVNNERQSSLDEISDGILQEIPASP